MITLDEYFKQTHNEYGIDRTLLIERLKLTPTERLREHESFLAQIEELRRTIRRHPHDTVPKNNSNTGQ